MAESIPVSEEEFVPSSSSPREQVVEVASVMLRGELSVIEGSRLLSRLQFLVSSLDHDPDFIPFVGIDSETDKYPLGDFRRHWAKDALAKLDLERRAAEDHYRDWGLSSAQRLVDRFGSDSRGQAPAT